MRIGFDAKRYFHNTTGLGNYSRSLINGFAKHHPNHDYVLFSPKANRDPAPASLQVVTKPAVSILWRQYGLSNALTKHKIDVYHGLSAELPYIRPGKTRQVVTIHDMIFMHYPQYYPLVDRIIYAHKTGNALQQANRIIASSEQTKRDLEKLMEKRPRTIDVIYQDCNPIFYEHIDPKTLEEFRQKKQLPEQFILMVSKFEKRKNHLRVLEAFKNAKLDYPLVMVGRKGDTYNEVQNYIQSHNLAPRVTVFTEVETNELPLFYRLAEASIFPSEYEGFGIPVLESLASGTPVLTSRDSCMQEISKNAGIYVDPLDVESILAGLEKLNDPNTVRDLSTAIPDRLPHFRNELLLQQHMNLYNELL
jgi:glycosyltransferase involved in cell wall biosynthesis